MSSFKVGEIVWINSSRFTSQNYSRFNIKPGMLGQSSVIKEVYHHTYGTHQRVLLEDYPRRNMDSRDLGYECTYEPFDMSTLPTYFQGLEELTTSTGGRYNAEFIMYKDDQSILEGLNGKSLWVFLENTLPDRDYDDDPCDGCWGDCDDCDGESGNPDWQNRQNRSIIDVPKLQVLGLVNGNHACFADLMIDWSYLRSEYFVHPDRLLLMLRHDQILQDLRSDEVVKFFNSMKSAKCLPYYLKIPKSRELETNDKTYYNIKLRKVSKEKLFWYLCVLRNPCEQPALVAYTNHFIDKGMEPLTAYITSHACLKGFHGGHSVVGYPDEIRDSQYKYTDELPFHLPDVPAVVKMAVQCRKLLTRKTLPYIHEIEDHDLSYDWRLSSEINSTQIRWTPPKVTTTTLHKFSPVTRKLED